MISGVGVFGENTSITSINFINAELTVSGALFFDEDIQTRYNLQVGDTINISNSAIGGNNISVNITSFGSTPSGFYIVTDGALTTEVTTLATCSFNSQYDELPVGCGMLPSQVDIDGHIEVQTGFSSGFANYDFYIKDTVISQDFINSEIYFPSGLYQLPRKGRAGVGITVPPLALDDTKEIGQDNVLNASNLVINRSTRDKFYNAVIYKYEIDSLDDRFLAGQITQSAESTNRIRVGNKPFTVKSTGLRKNAETDNLIKLQTRRQLDRYQFAAESIDVIVNYSTGFTIEVGDTVIFKGGELQVVDISKGNRDFDDRVMEVVNKSLNITSGEIKLSLVDTAFLLDGLYGVISPSSIIDAGSTTTNIKIKDSYGTGFTSILIEQQKWLPYIGQNILVRDQSWSTLYNTKIVGFSETDQSIMIVDPALPAPPSEGWEIDIPTYDSTSETIDSVYKNIHCYWQRRISIVSGLNDQQFTVSGADVGDLYVGALLDVHNFDYSSRSPDPNVEITDITGNTITVNNSLGFTPDNTFFVSLIGFVDKKLPYRLL
jgi:hypothetical protein